MATQSETSASVADRRDIGRLVVSGCVVGLWLGGGRSGEPPKQAAAAPDPATWTTHNPTGSAPGRSLGHRPHVLPHVRTPRFRHTERGPHMAANSTDIGSRDRADVIVATKWPQVAGGARPLRAVPPLEARFDVLFDHARCRTQARIDSGGSWIASEHAFRKCWSFWDAKSGLRISRYAGGRYLLARRPVYSHLPVLNWESGGVRGAPRLVGCWESFGSSPPPAREQWVVDSNNFPAQRPGQEKKTWKLTPSLRPTRTPSAPLQSIPSFVIPPF